MAEVERNVVVILDSNGDELHFDVLTQIHRTPKSFPNFRETVFRQWVMAQWLSTAEW